jgi:signal transduction histidine kinase
VFGTFPAYVADMAVMGIPRRLGIGPSDALWAFGLLPLAYWELWFDWHNYFPSADPHLMIDSVTVTIACLALLFRRRMPLAVLLVTGAAMMLPDLLVQTGPAMWGEWVPFLVAAYSVAVARNGRADAFAFVLGGAAFAVFSWRFPAEFRAGAAALAWFGPLILVVVTGRVIGRMRETSRQLRERTDELERTRDEEAELAVALERQRIARELHDVIAHNVSIMVVQAGAAENVLDSDPPFVRKALASVQTAGREALEEMKLLLGLLRSDDGNGARAPVPSLRRLDALIDPLRESGMRIAFETHGLDQRIPSSVDVSAYRIVQEALTNALRHAPNADVRVVVHVDQSAVRVEVVDDGEGPSRWSESGHGLLGLRERVVLHGGHLYAGPDAGHGFAVRAELPLSAAASR